MSLENGWGESECAIAFRILSVVNVITLIILHENMNLSIDCTRTISD